MGYQALYRKYRPKNFEEIAGQEITVKILKNSIIKDKISHAYLFYGPRGTGKTSIAKILARTINCEKNNEAKPCENCENCRISNSKECVDIIEIDAASNNGVDEIREIKNKVNLVPSELKYKIYIIDEVHMLSIGAFNALLKTLEEPPEHVIFILATTELHKVPSTILSRCQTLEFKRVPNKDIIERLCTICDLENIFIDDNALEEIAIYSDGGMRDALSLLDKAVSYSNENITAEDIRNLTGNINKEKIDQLANMILNHEIDNLLIEINELYNSGKDLIKVVEDIIISLRNKIDDATKKEKLNICSIIKKLNSTIEQMKTSTNLKILLEVNLIELSSTKDDNDEEIITNNQSIATPKVTEIKKNIPENNEEKQKDENQSTSQTNNAEIKHISKIRINNALAEADKQELLRIRQLWNNLNNYTFDRDYGAIVCDLIDSMPVVASKSYIILTYNYQSFVDKGNKLLNKYNDVLKNLLNLDHKIIFITADEWNQEKQKYITNLKNNIKYELIDENDVDDSEEISVQPEVENDDDNLIQKVTDLFGKDNVEIK